MRVRTMPVLRLPKFGKPVKYAYITGRVRAMKTKLIPADMYPRMMSMEMAEIARYLEEESGLPFTEKHLVMTIGAAGGLNVVFKAILDEGDANSSTNPGIEFACCGTGCVIDAVIQITECMPDRYCGSFISDIPKLQNGRPPHKRVFRLGPDDDL